MTHVIFRSAGAGASVLLLHAFPLNSAMWTGQMSALGNSAAFLAPDLPGFGASARSQPVTDIDVLARTIYEDVRARGIHAAVIAGCSMGGYLAFALLRVAPDFVQGLALINTKASADLEQAQANRLALVQRVEREGCHFLVDEWPPTALSPVTRTHRADVVQAVRDMIAEATPAGVTAAQRAMASRPDSTPQLGTIRVPTIVIHGLDDTLVPEAHARAMAAAIPDAKFVGIPEAGHVPNLEQPTLVNEALADLLRAV